MPKFNSSNPIFVDLFYGVVVGSSISTLSLDCPKLLVYQVLWIVAVLEDWFLYYSRVVDSPDKAVPWNFRSLMIEFAILLSWYLGFDALDDVKTQGLFFVFLAAFYGVKILGGISFNLKHKTLLSLRMLYDCVWILPIACALWFVWGGQQLTFDQKYWILAAVTAGSLVIWWIASLKAPSKAE